MEPRKLLADISRQFFKDKKVYRYRTKKVVDMTDDEVIRNCHWYYQENNLTAEWRAYREKVESEYYYCSYLEQYIEQGYCYDLQMIVCGFVKSSALPELNIDKEKCAELCSTCKHSL